MGCDRLDTLPGPDRHLCDLSVAYAIARPVYAESCLEWPSAPTNLPSAAMRISLAGGRSFCLELVGLASSREERQGWRLSRTKVWESAAFSLFSKSAVLPRWRYSASISHRNSRAVSPQGVLALLVVAIHHLDAPSCRESLVLIEAGRGVVDGL